MRMRAASGVAGPDGLDDGEVLIERTSWNQVRKLAQIVDPVHLPSRDGDRTPRHGQAAGIEERLVECFIQPVDTEHPHSSPRHAGDAPRI